MSTAQTVTMLSTWLIPCLRGFVIKKVKEVNRTINPFFLYLLVFFTSVFFTQVYLRKFVLWEVSKRQAVWLEIQRGKLVATPFNIRVCNNLSLSVSLSEGLRSREGRYSPKSFVNTICFSSGRPLVGEIGVSLGGRERWWLALGFLGCTPLDGGS